MIEVKTEDNKSIKNKCCNHESIWFPINAFIDLNTNSYMIDCACLKCKITRTFPKREVIKDPSFVPVNLGVIIPLSMALNDYKILSECYQNNLDIVDSSKQDKIICKTMKKRYASRY